MTQRTPFLPLTHWLWSLAALLGLATMPAHAVEAKLTRHPDYHNGRLIFSYLGDLWLLEDRSTQPRRLTVHRARDIHPRFSPDGKWIAFSSNRYGNYDVFLMPAEGGKAKRLTYHSAGDTVVGWSRDSQRVIFSSPRGRLYGGIANLYEMPIGGEQEEPLPTDWGYWGSYSPDGKKLAFNRHPMTWSRKHYRGSYAADLWVLDLQKNSYRRLVDDKLPDEWKSNNFWPMYANGYIYFVSDRQVKAKAGSSEALQSVNNIWKVPEDGGEPVQVTQHSSGALFFPSLSSDGKTIVYEENFGIAKLDVQSGKSTPVKIDIAADDPDNVLETLTFNGEADGYHLSPSGKRAVISIHGELFSIATEKGEIRRLTQTPGARDVQPTWSPDGKWIAFISDKSGTEEVWLCDERGGQMKQVSQGDSIKGQIRWSPDAKALLYTSANKLVRYNLDTEKSVNLIAAAARTSSGGMPIINPQWSPDGKWIAFTRSDATFLPHVYVMPAEGGKERRITESDSYSDTSAYWTADGKYLVYQGGVELVVPISSVQPRSRAQIFAVSLTRETERLTEKGIDSEEEAAKQKPKRKFGEADGDAGPAKKPADVKIDFERIGRRARQLTRTPDNITSLSVAPDGKTVVFVTSGVEGGRSVQSIWSLQIDGEKLTRVAQSTMATDEEGPPRGRFGGFTGGLSSLQFSRDGRTLYYQQGKGIYSTSLGGGGPAAASETPRGPGTLPGRGTSGAAATGATASGKKINFTARVEADHRAQRRQVFKESWRVMKHRFYAEDMHGVDWAKARDLYEPLLDHVGSQDDLFDLVNMMLGELNASHTGISGGFGGGGGRGESAQLGTRFPGFELEADKSGFYRITHVYKNGPADKDYIKLKAGDYLIAVADEELKAGDNYWKAFTTAPGVRLDFTVNSKPAKEGSWKVHITPVSLTQHSNLQYEKWVDDRRAMVSKLAGDDIGYLHIRQMSEPALRQFERDLAMLSTKKALVIDQRFNPGGNIDQELLQILGQRQYQVTQVRDSLKATRPMRGFFGPMVVLANERSTSDAEVFPDGFRTLKLGKIVGVTTYGAVIGTGSYRLMDGSSIRTPSSGLWNVSGVNLENYGVPPDIYVDNRPEDFFAGRDPQLERAVAVVQEEIGKRK
jgi:tricorn protease